MDSIRPQVDLELGNIEPEVKQSTNKPWKQLGYPAFSRWMSSSDDFLVLRRFSTLNVRILLLLQDRIVRLEQDLSLYDEAARQAPDEFANSGSFRLDAWEDRKTILDQLLPLLEQYNNYLVAFSEIQRWEPAKTRQWHNLDNWLNHNHKKAISEEEAQFSQETRDLVTLVSDQKSPLESLVERFPRLLISKALRSVSKSSQVPSATTTYYSKKRLRNIAFVVILGAGLLLLLGPLWALQFVGDNIKRLAIITCFIMLFTAALASATVAKPFEVLAATAA
ncbi:hypothetical protein Daus18300_004062 [Diaporthe australafricana]|uniref:DUF6594 domain-containing protein n=1 Tax=Diaporthe australafricana TaxID=127596 RepID=A0ABR3XBB0_9PEZI